MYLLADDIYVYVVIGVVVAVVFFVFLFVASRFKRCPSNKVLVIYGKVGRDKSAMCVHGGGKFVLPLIQDYEFLDLSPRTIEIELIGALSRKNIRVNVPSTFTIGISTRTEIMQNAAERLLTLTDREISSQCQDIILGQMRLVIATMSIEEINMDREKFLDLVNQNVGMELQKIGLEVINVNIRDITDESGYIEAIGKKAAAEAVNQAKIEVARALKMGAMGEAEALREQEVRVAAEVARSSEGQKEAERDQRVAVASLEANAIEGENTSKATIAGANARLAEAEAEAKQIADVARANADRAVFDAEKDKEMARLSMEEVARQEIDRMKVEIEADAKAEQIRRVAAGQADAILAKATAEAKGLQLVLEAKATGYERLMGACDNRPDLAPTLLMIEKIEDVVAEQVKAIQNLKIDKITVWDGGRENGNGQGGTAGFLSGLMQALPPMHDLAKQAGVELPEFLGRLHDSKNRNAEANVAADHAGSGNTRPEPPSKSAETREG